MDKIQHHFHNSIFSLFDHNWWNPEISWNNKNKYINEGDSKLRVWFYTAAMVTFTDAFHLFKSIRDNSLLLCIALLIPNINTLIAFIGIKILYSVTFHILYMYIFKK